MLSHGKLGVLLVSLFAASGLVMAAGPKALASGPPLGNWSAPATYTPSASQSRIRALSDISNPVPFIATAPCRQYNSLLATPLLQSVNRAVTLTGAPCGIPTSAVAVSVNITVFNISGATGNGVFKVDTFTPPAVAWINYPPSEAQRGNAGVVALNGSGQIIVQVAQGAGQVDFIVDTNGYYASTPATSSNYFQVVNSGPYAIFGQTDSSSTNAVGVYGSATAGTGITYGVWGDDFSTSTFGIGVVGISHATTGQTYGVFGRTNSTSDGAVGTYGEAVGTSGATYGVEGVNSSSQGVGVRGVAVGTSGATYGVEGVNSSSQGVGVRGVGASGSVIAVGGEAGVRGESIFYQGVNGRSRSQAVLGQLYSAGGFVAAGSLGDSNFGGPWGVYAFGQEESRRRQQPHSS